MYNKSVLQQSDFFRLALAKLKVSFNSAPSKSLVKSFYYYNKIFTTFGKSSLITLDHMKANKDIYFRLT